MVLWELTLSWGRIGLFGFGGGPGMLPFIKNECVDVRAWMTETELLDALAVGYSLPGPIAAKLSVEVGLRVAGPMGALVAFLAVMAPSAALMAGLMAVVLRYRDNPWLAGAMKAVKPAVIALLAWTVIDLAPAGLRDWKGALLGLLALGALLLRVHPAIVMVCMMVLGAALLR